jgi:hypothetical protein
MWIVLFCLLVLFTTSADAQQVTDRTKVTNTTVTCGAGSVAALAVNENRNFLMFTNDHATQVIYLSNDGTGAPAAATVNNGIRVSAAGGSIMFDVKVPLGAFNCIATGATTPLLVSEGTK